MTVLMLDSITDVDTDARGQVAVSGSHGGIYPAVVASQAGLRAVAFNDAGIGYQRAGIAGVLALERVGMAAIAADCQTCRIGDAADLLARGRVGTANTVAQTLGIAAGIAMSEAVEALAGAPAPTDRLPKIAEARRSHHLPTGQTVELLDSASLVVPEDKGRIVITGSHGALIGGDPVRALKTAAQIAVFNDAGIGIEGIGITRLPALDQRGVAAVTVSADSCRIGDAASALETGVISHANSLAVLRGAAVGRWLEDWLRSFG